MGTTVQRMDEAEELTAKFGELGELALARHAERHDARPQRPVASYLRMGLVCVREMTHYLRYAPARYLAQAQDLLARITSTAEDAETACYAAGGNSAPYQGILILAEGWRLRLRYLAEEWGLATPTMPHPLPKAIPLYDAPTTVTPPALPRPPRRYVPPNQGGDKRAHHAHR